MIFGVILVGLLGIGVFLLCFSAGARRRDANDNKRGFQSGVSQGAPSQASGLASGAQRLLEAPNSTNSAQSPMQARYAVPQQQSIVAAGDSGPPVLPPICPSLILPHTEAP